MFLGVLGQLLGLVECGAGSGVVDFLCGGLRFGAQGVGAVDLVTVAVGQGGLQVGIRKAPYAIACERAIGSERKYKRRFGDACRSVSY